MMKKNTVKKSVIAAALATSLLTSTNVGYANSSLQEIVDQARKDMKDAAYAYVVPSQNGKIATSKELYPSLNKAKANYEKAKKAIEQTNAKNKDTLLKDLNELYNEKITKGIVPYIDAYNYADKYLNPIMANIKKAEAEKDWAEVEKQYHKLSAQLKSRTAILYRFSGKAARDLLLDLYKEPANQKREQLMVPVTIYMKVQEADKLLAAGKKEEATKVLESIIPLQDKVPSLSALPMLKELLDEVIVVAEKAGIEIIPNPTTPKPTPPPTSGGNNGGGNSDSGNSGSSNFKLSVMHTNDIHSSLDKAAERVTAVKEVRAAKPNALLLDAGDATTGTLYFNEFKGKAEIEFMNLMGYDAMTFGNHEFDLGSSDEGLEALKDFVVAANFPFVSANVDFAKDDKFTGLFSDLISSKPEKGQIYQGIIKEVQGQRVGIFGLTTAETAQLSSPGAITFEDYKAEAEKAVKAFEAQGVNKIIAISHLGYDDNPAVDNDLLLAEEVEGIDLIVGGHSHTTLTKPVVVDKDGTPTVIVQTGNANANLGVVDLTFNNRGLVVGQVGELIKIDKQTPDAEAAALLAPYKTKVDEIASQEIGVSAAVALTNPRTGDEGNTTGESVRKNETILGNVITDGMLQKAKEATNKEVIMAFQNGGGIRAAINAGPITVGEVITVLPFGNTLATMDITGKEIKEAFELSFSKYPTENGGFLHVAGAKVEYDSSKPAGQRVVSIAYQDADKYTAIVDNKTYTIATNAFTAKGGDGYDVLAKAYADGRVTDLGLSDWENFREHLVSLGSIPTEIEGRIVDVKGQVVDPEPEIVVDPGTTPTPVATTTPPLYNSNAEKLIVSQVARYDSGQGETGTEILAFDKTTNKAFVTNGAVGGFDILSFADVKSGQFTQVDSTKRIVIEDYGITGVKNITSIASHPTADLIAIAAYGEKTDRGYIVFTDKDGKYVKHVQVGYLPDMVTFTPDGIKAIVANEGEPENTNTENDPAGSISVIDISSFNHTELQFTEGMLDEKVRMSFQGKGKSYLEQLEPEYVTVSADSKTAYVTLQENNAIATVDLESNTILHVKGLGVLDHSVDGFEMDAFNDKDGTNKIGISKAPILTFHMPDAIDTFIVGGKTYIITPNEGDSRDYADDEQYSEVAEVKTAGTLNKLPIKLKETHYEGYSQDELSGFDFNTIKDYKATIENGLNDAGTEYEAIYGYGGRSFSIFDAATMRQVFDSGSQFEKIIADKTPQYFNINSDEIKVDNRSDDKGPEPETAVVGKIDGKTYAFIALERYSGIMVYDLTDVNAPEFVTLISSRDFSKDAAGDVSPEGLQFIPASDSPTGKALLAATHEVSGTVAVYEFEGTGTPVTPVTVVAAAAFTGTAENPTTFEGNISVDVSAVTSLKNAIIKGDLILTGNPTGKVSFENITVEGNFDLSGLDEDIDFDGITVTGESNL